MVTIIFTRQAEKSFTKLPKFAQRKISKAIEKIEQNPLVGERLSGEFTGQLKLYAWPYRVIYLFLAEERIVTILEIGHRQGVYK